jgi:hypothetical protein
VQTAAHAPRKHASLGGGDSERQTLPIWHRSNWARQSSDRRKWEVATYAVTSREPVSAETYAGDIVGPTEAPKLTSITCTGDLDGSDYTSRLIANATRT